MNFSVQGKRQCFKPVRGSKVDTLIFFTEICSSGLFPDTVRFRMPNSIVSSMLRSGAPYSLGVKVHIENPSSDSVLVLMTAGRGGQNASVVSRVYSSISAVYPGGLFKPLCVTRSNLNGNLSGRPSMTDDARRARRDRP